MNGRYTIITLAAQCLVALIIVGITGTAVILEKNVPEWWPPFATAAVAFTFQAKVPTKEIPILPK